MYSNIGKRGRMMEEYFFRKNDDALKKRHEELQKMKQTEETLEKISGIKNKALILRFIELKITPPVLASLAVIPMVAAAWADGNMDDEEKTVVLKAASEKGIGKGSVDYDLMEQWLDKKPPASLLESWVGFVNTVCGEMSPEERVVFKKNIMEKAKAVAAASGGFLGFGSKISKEEAEVLKKMEKAFCAGNESLEPV